MRKLIQKELVAHTTQLVGGRTEAGAPNRALIEKGVSSLVYLTKQI